MDIALKLILAASLLGALVCGLLSLASYDQFVAKFAELMPVRWRECGCPVGYFWRPAEGVELARDVVSGEFRTEVGTMPPAWLRESPELQACLARYRRMLWLSCLAGGLGLVAGLLILGV